MYEGIEIYKDAKIFITFFYQLVNIPYNNLLPENLSIVHHVYSSNTQTLRTVL